MRNHVTRRAIRVLIVDDHEIIRTAIRRALRHAEGIVVVGDAADGAAAIELVDKARPDVVVMDMNMPVMDGLEATLAIKTAHPHIAVISFSSDDVEAMTRASDASVEKGRTKELVDKIRRLGSHFDAVDEKQRDAPIE